jgi:hypothetical protein
MATIIAWSKVTLKPVLVHNGNKKPPMLEAHEVGMEETFESMSHLLSAIIVGSCVVS